MRAHDFNMAHVAEVEHRANKQVLVLMQVVFAVRTSMAGA
jgi:hypothetical protein